MTVLFDIIELNLTDIIKKGKIKKNCCESCNVRYNIEVKLIFSKQCVNAVTNYRRAEHAEWSQK